MKKLDRMVDRVKPWFMVHGFVLGSVCDSVHGSVNGLVHGFVHDSWFKGFESSPGLWFMVLFLVLFMILFMVW